MFRRSWKNPWVALCVLLLCQPLRGQDKGDTLRVGVESDLYPISHLDGNGKPAGFAVDILNGISAEMGVRFEPVVLARDTLWASFRARQIPAMASAVKTKERESTMAFTATDLELHSLLWVRRNEKPIHSLADLKGMRFAVMHGTLGKTYVDDQGLGEGELIVADQRAALHAVIDGRADATIGTRVFGTKYIAEDHMTGIRGADLDLPDLTYHFAIAVQPGDTLWLSRLDEGLARMRADGSYDRIYERWIGPLEPRPLHYADLSPYVVPIALAVVAVFGALIWQRRLLRRLANQAEELRTSARERDKLQQKMIEAQKLESLGVLAGGIAHDFNNLLTVILGNATLGKEMASEGKFRQLLGHIEKAAHRAADLCRQMLAYSGRAAVVFERLELNAAVRDTAALLEPTLVAKASLRVDLAQDLPAVEGDPIQLRQVVMNLLLNAAEAMERTPGEIKVSTLEARPEPGAGGAIYSFELPQGRCVCLRVADTGCGMSPETLARIFDPFFTTKFAGRGLGLASVLGIVRAHNGALHVTSEPGRGSVFSLHLAASRGAAPALQAQMPAASAAAPGSGLVLVADDEPGVLATASAILGRNGYGVVTAEGGDEAVEKYCQRPGDFAAVLLDLTMPGTDGADAMAAIRKRNPLAKVVIMSGYSEEHVNARLHDLEPVAVLRKPFEPDRLLSLIASAAASTT